MIFETQIFFCCYNTNELFEQRLKTVPYQWSPGNKISANITDLWGFFSSELQPSKCPSVYPWKPDPGIASLLEKNSLFLDYTSGSLNCCLPLQCQGIQISLTYTEAIRKESNQHYSEQHKQLFQKKFAPAVSTQSPSVSEAKLNLGQTLHEKRRATGLMCTRGVCVGFFSFLSIHLQEALSKVSKEQSKSAHLHAAIPSVGCPAHLN